MLLYGTAQGIAQSEYTPLTPVTHTDTHTHHSDSLPEIVYLGFYFDRLALGTVEAKLRHVTTFVTHLLKY